MLSTSLKLLTVNNIIDFSTYKSRDTDAKPVWNVFKYFDLIVLSIQLNEVIPNVVYFNLIEQNT